MQARSINPPSLYLTAMRVILHTLRRPKKFTLESYLEFTNSIYTAPPMIREAICASHKICPTGYIRWVLVIYITADELAEYVSRVYKTKTPLVPPLQIRQNKSEWFRVIDANGQRYTLYEFETINYKYIEGLDPKRPGELVFGQD